VAGEATLRSYLRKGVDWMLENIGLPPTFSNRVVNYLPDIVVLIALL